MVAPAGTAKDAGDYRIALIAIAREVAVAGTGATHITGGAGRAQFLRRFRAAYQFLAASVENTEQSSDRQQANLKDTEALLAEFDGGK